MNSYQPSDQKYRDGILRKLDTNFFVEAGAGSGKTTSLTGRMVALIQQGKCNITDIAAITFTKKAASELREKFKQRLEERLKVTEERDSKKRLTDALENIEGCFIGTIHAFCIRILKERPIEAGLDPEFEVLDEVQATVIKEQAWKSYVLANSDIVARLGQKGLTPSILKANYLTLLDQRDVTFPCEDTEKPNLDPVLDILRSLIANALTYIPFPSNEYKYDALQEKILSAARRLEFHDLTSELQIVNILKTFDKGTFKITQKRWINKEMAKLIQKQFECFAEDEIKPVLTKWREHCYKHVLDFLLPAVQAFQVHKKELGVLDFQDLLTKTAQLLRENSEVRCYFQKKYPKLLVDEFQDVDPLQCEIMICLTSRDLFEKNWMKLIPNFGSLFVVGDPKQSIYRFRRADLDTYNYLKELIQKSGGEVVSLTENFRSVKSLGSFYNSVFEDQFNTQSDRYQVHYKPMVTAIENQGYSGLYVLNIPAHFTSADQVALEDARLVANSIKYLLDRDKELKPRDILVVTRYKKRLPKYAEALEALGIPTNITGGSYLGEIKEVQELLRLCKALDNLDDQVALVAVLKGMFFAISDQMLYDFNKAKGIFSVWSDIPQDLKADVFTVFAEAYNTIRSFISYTRNLPPAAALKQIVTELGIVPKLLVEDLGKRSCGQLMQVIELIGSSQLKTIFTWADLVVYFENLLLNTPDDELSLMPNYNDAVRVMNLHKAKGLEAKVVFLADPVASTDFLPSIHITRKAAQPIGYLRVTEKRVYQSTDCALPFDWKTYEKEEIRYLKAEETRLLYVAATRAKQMLVVSNSLCSKVNARNPWRLLLAGPNLQTLQVPQQKVEKIRSDINQNLGPAEDGFAKCIEELSRESYLTRNPSRVIGIPRIDRDADGGLTWGRACHQVLEAFVRGNTDTKTLIAKAIKDHRLPEERTEELDQVVTKFSKKLLDRLTHADYVLTEVPFAVSIKTDKTIPHTAQTTESKPILVTGVIDLVIKEKGQWTIVDYKSDRITKEKDLVNLAEHYKNQLLLYTRAWKIITGEPISRCLIYFLYSDQLLQVSFESELMEG